MRLLLGLTLLLLACGQEAPPPEPTEIIVETNVCQGCCPGHGGRFPMPEYREVGLFVQDMDTSDLVLTGKVTHHEPTAIQFTVEDGYRMAIRFTLEPEQWFKGREEGPIQFVAEYCDKKRWELYPTAEEATAEIARLFKYKFAKPPRGQQWLLHLDRREFGLYGGWLYHDSFEHTPQMYAVHQERFRYFNDITRQQEDMSLGELEDLMTELGPR